MPNYEITPVELVYGTDAGSDPKVAKGLLKVQNGRWDREGAVQKRVGHELSDTGTSNANRFVSEWNDRPITFGKSLRLGYTAPTATEEIDDEFYVVQVDRSDTSFLYDTPKNIDYCELDNVYAVSFETYGRKTVISYEKGTNRLIDSYTDVDSATSEDYVRLVRFSSTRMYYMYHSADNFDIRYGTIDDAGAIQSSPSTITGTSASLTEGTFDVCVTPVAAGSDLLSVIFVTIANDIAIAQLPDGDDSLKTISTVSVSDRIDAACCVPYADAETFFAWSETNTTTGAVLARGVVRGSNAATVVVTQDTMLTGTNGDIVRNIVCSPGQSGSVNVYVQRLHNYGTWPTATYDYTFVRGYRYYSASGTGTTSALTNGLCYNLMLISKPFRIDGGFHAVCYTRQYEKGATNFNSASSDEDSIQGSYWIVRLPTYNVAGSFQQIAKTHTGYASCGWTFGADNFATSVFQPNQGTSPSGEPVYVVPFVNDVRTSQSFFKASIVTVDENPEPPQSIPYGRITLISGSVPCLFDGTSLSETGFSQYPEKISHYQNGAGSNLTAGTYLFRAVYEWTDAAGNLYRSSPTPDPLSVTLGAPVLNIQVYVPNIPVQRKSTAKIVLYRTVNGGTIYYRDGESDLPDVADSGAHTVVTCSTPDALITSNSVLYTDSGEQPNDPPPSHWVGTIFQGRHVSVQSGTNQLFYSKPIEPWTGIHYTADNYVNLDPSSGEVTALIPLVDKLLICTASRIYAMEGIGFDNIGGGSNYPPPYIVSHSVGAENHRGVARIGSGIIFKSSDIFYSMDGSMQLSPIGEPVRYYTDTYSVKGTSKNNADHYITVHTDGPALCYDWLRQRWSTFTDSACVDAVGIGDRAFWLQARSTYYDLLSDRSTAVYKDEVLSGSGATPVSTDTHITTLVDTGWISLAPNARYYRVLLTGQNLSAHTLRCRVAYNYDPNWTDDLTISSAATTAFPHTDYYGTGLSSAYADQSYVLEFHLSKQLAESIRLEISDESRVAEKDQASWTLSKISLLSAPKGSVRRRGTGRRF